MKINNFIHFLNIGPSEKMCKAVRPVLGFILLFSSALLLTSHVNAQITGDVFRDFNGNGIRQNDVGVFVEPLAAGVIVTAYNSNDVVLASYTTTTAYDAVNKTTYGGSPNFSIPTSGTAYNNIKGSNTGFVDNNVAVRLEFVIPTNVACLLSGIYDFSSKSGKTYGTSVRFLTGSANPRTDNNFAFNNPNDYVAAANPKSGTYVFQAFQFGGNPLAGTGTSRIQKALVKFPYNRNGLTPLISPDEILATAEQIGSVYGVAYSKYAKRVFTSAFMKRHSGFGPANGTAANAPGAIYIVNPTLNSSSSAASFLFSLDQKGFPTHNTTGTPTYADAYSLSSTQSGNIRTETITYSAGGLGVIGTNVIRGLGNDISTPSNDPAAFGQVGRVSLGAIELSEDGRYLFVVNLFDRKIYQFLLNSVTNPTDASYVNSWNLPDPPARSASGLTGAATTYATSATINDYYNGVRGVQRPFALKYRRGKLYIGSVTTGEGAGAVNTLEDNAGNVAYSDLWSYVWELNPSAGVPIPVLQFPLNYRRGVNHPDLFDERWRPWSNTIPDANVSTSTGLHGQWSLTQPMLTGIEFDVEGSMILAFRDRSGDQGGSRNYMLSGTQDRSATAYGDQLRAYKNPSTCTFELEKNAKEGPSSEKIATGGKDAGPNPDNDHPGPGGGEFYYQDGVDVFNGDPQTFRYQLNTAMGGLALLPGMEEVTATYMDAMGPWSGGISWMNNNNGSNPRDYELYDGMAVGQIGKANGLGDVELLFETAPIEIGNRVWKDGNKDGIQNVGEAGIAGVLIELINSVGTVIGTVTTDSEGTWYFSTDSGTDVTGMKYGVAILPNETYKVRLATTGEGNDWDPTANSGVGGPRASGALDGLTLTGTNSTGNGEADFSDSDALLVNKIPEISLTTGGYGENNHTYDIGFIVGSPLPVKLINFDGKADEANHVRLDWNTSQEWNSSYFGVQRSTDGVTWNGIGTVSALGKSEIAHGYTFLDLNPLNGNGLYRLQMVDVDATSAYSRIINVKLETMFSLNLYPNPASDKLKIEASNGAAVQKAQLYSLLGKLVKEVIAPKQGEINVQSLAAGAYTVRITTADGSVEMRKVIITH